MGNQLDTSKVHVLDIFSIFGGRKRQFMISYAMYIIHNYEKG